MKNITFTDAGSVSELAWPQSVDDVTPESLALEVFTDFTRTRPLVIDARTNAIDTEELMKTPMFV